MGCILNYMKLHLNIKYDFLSFFISYETEIFIHAKETLMRTVFEVIKSSKGE